MSKPGYYPSSLPSARRAKAPVVPAPGLILADYLPLIQRLAEMRQEQQSGIVVAFGAFSRRQGVTYVIESLACQLAQHTGEQILLSPSASLAGVARATFWEPQGIQRLGGGRRREFRTPGWDDLQTVRSKFGFVLVDCPALSESPTVLSLSKIVDGVALVIASGEMRRHEIQEGCRSFQALGVKVVGLVLNKRTDPVPRLFSRWL